MIWDEPVDPKELNALKDKMMTQVDLDLCQALVEKYSDQAVQAERSKYAKDPHKTMRDACRRVLRLGLHKAPPMKILDIGTGAGFFPMACAHFGHSCHTVDVLATGFYAEMIQAHGISQDVARIRAFQPFPVKGPFDLITAFAIAFDKLKGRVPWSETEWSDFLDRALAEVNPGGRIALHFNWSYGDKRYTPEILAELQARNAMVDDYWAVLPKG